jgi:outer membrane protein assembly factor BamB
VIAAVGIDLGVTAFILGLAVTGWAETARLVSELTKTIRSMPYIEAARSLGQSGAGLIRDHVLRQIAPMLSMLFAFEVSGTLLAATSLGFLGYYIGGEVWTPITDTTSLRSAGMPELGLMVATLSTDIFAGPYKLVAAGTLIFMTILGFNLLGEGLRLRLERGRPRISFWTLWVERLSLAFDQHIIHPVSVRLRRSRALTASLVIVSLGSLIGIGWAVLKPAPAGVIPAALSIPGGHLWASRLHDPYGTAQTSALGPQSEPYVQWVQHTQSSFTGGPVIAADGTLYLTTLDGRLLTYSQSGKSNWQVELESEPVGSPALSAQGRIYIADKLGGLTAVSPVGRILWHVQPEGTLPATSGPTVHPDGTVYYMRSGQVQAVSPQGSPLWLSQARPYRTSLPPALNPDGSLLFALDAVLRAEDGEKLTFDPLADADQLFTGADGRAYARSRLLLVEWQAQGDGAQIVQRIDWDYHFYGLISPPNQVGASAGTRLWMLYYSSFEDGHVIWLDGTGRVTGEVRFPHRETSLIGLDGSGWMYVCGTSRISHTAECLAVDPDQSEPAWTLPLPYGASIAGGAIASGTLYVATSDGYLISIGSQAAPNPAP